MRYIVHLLLLLLLTFAAQAHAQNTSTQIDKPLSFEGYTLTDSLTYSAGAIEYYFDDRRAVMNENAEIHYLGRTLTSNTITLYQRHDYMEATGRVDSTGTLVDTPVFTDTSGEKLDGLKIKYNMRTEQGIVSEGRTKYDTGYYNSNIIKRVADDTLYVADGSFTTCDLKDKPHFYFAGKKMKFITNDKLIIKPIVAYLSDIPVFWFPFYVYPITHGRQSGILTPRYGSSRRDGRYVSNLGYYFAPSEYYDYRVAGVIREKNGWLVKNWLNYEKKYSLSGSVFGSYENRTDTDQKEYEFRISHRQTVSPTLSISGSGNFQSSEYSRYNSRNIHDRMNRELRSSLEVSKRWEDSGNSLSSSFTHTKNLDTENSTTVLPNLRFRMPRKRLFGDDSDKKKVRRKYADTGKDSSKEPAWYENIYYSSDARFSSTEKSRLERVDPIEPNALPDTVKVENFDRELQLSSSVSGSQKLMGWLVAEPSVNLSETFAATSEAQIGERYQREDNISVRMGLGTTIYGMFSTSIGNMRAIRHVMKPSVTYSYGKQRSYAGEDMEAYYRFGENDEDNGKIRRMNISLRNLIQAKTVREDKENKFDMFTLDFSTSVDFEKDEKLAPLSTTLDFQPLKKYFSTRLTARHSFYDENGDLDIFDPYLDNISITSTVGMSGGGPSFLSRSSTETANSMVGRDEFEDVDVFDDMDGEEDGGEEPGAFPIPLKMRFTHTYQLNRTSAKKSDGSFKYRATHNIKPSLSLSLSEKWSLSYFIYYDFEDDTINMQRLTASRDLHCWEANISWIPSGVQEGYYIKVNIKDLPDIKIEKKRGTAQTSY